MFVVLALSYGENLKTRNEIYGFLKKGAFICMNSLNNNLIYKPIDF